jgi:hypothetical protein
MLRTDIPYTAPSGNLTQAGFQALKSEFTGLDTRLVAVETELAASLVNLQTAVTASGTTVDFTGIPSWVNRITVLGRGISTNGTSRLVLRVGDGGIVGSGYLGAVTQVDGATPATANGTGSVLLTENQTAAMVFRFKCTIERITGNVWVFSGTGAFSNSASATIFASEISLTNALDRVRLSTAAGVDTFDAGSVNISLE